MFKRSELTRPAVSTLLLLVAIGSGIQSAAATGLPPSETAQPKLASSSVFDWSFIGGFIPHADLAAGDRVSFRFLDAKGKQVAAMALKIETGRTSKSVWTRDASNLINRADIGVKAGMTSPYGTFMTSGDRAYYFVDKLVPIASVITEIQKKSGAVTVLPALTTEQYSGVIAVSGVPTSVEKGVSKLTFTVRSKGNRVSAHAALYDMGTKRLVDDFGFDLDNKPMAQWVTVRGAVTGPLKLIVSGYEHDGSNESLMSISTVQYKGDLKYDYVFPGNVLKYTPGTAVLQPKDGSVYRCQPYPAGGYCSQWSISANQFEPGIGSDWRKAWLRQP